MLHQSNLSHRVVDAVCAGLLIAFVAAHFLKQDPSAAIVRGDLPAFYSMAIIASSAEPARLYDMELQQQVQNTFWPSMEGSVLPAVYPPYVGFFLQPLAALTPSVAHHVWSLLMVGAVLAAIAIICRANKSLIGFYRPTAIGFLLFTPALISIFGGQMAPLSILAYASILCLARLPGRRAEVLLGFVAGLWMFKPHYGLSVAFVLLLQRRWLAMTSYGCTLVVLWLLGAHVVGLSWVGAWLGAVNQFAHIDLLSNAYQMTGLVPIAYVLADRFGLGGGWSDSTWSAISGCIGLFVLLGLWITERTVQRSQPKASLVPFLVLGPLLVLCAPAVNFYDLSLSVVPLLMLFQPKAKRELMLAVLVILASHLHSMLREHKVPGASVGFALILFVLLVSALRREWPKGVTR